MSDDSNQSILITGANRGLGFALARVCLARGGWNVLAGCRHPDKTGALVRLREQHPKSLHILRLDVGVPRSVQAAAKVSAEHVERLDVLINNAAIYPGERHDTVESVDLAFARDAFETNASGPIRVIRDFLPLLRKSHRARVINISSGAGSLSKQPARPAGGGVNYAYAGSKAALNLFTRLVASDLKPENICVVALTPGWLKTEMGGPGAEMDPEESAAAIISTVDKLNMAQTALWLDRHGMESEYAW